MGLGRCPGGGGSSARLDVFYSVVGGIFQRSPLGPVPLQLQLYSPFQRQPRQTLCNATAISSAPRGRRPRGTQGLAAGTRGEVAVGTGAPGVPCPNPTPRQCPCARGMQPRVLYEPGLRLFPRFVIKNNNKKRCFYPQAERRGKLEEEAELRWQERPETPKQTQPFFPLRLELFLLKLVLFFVFI